MIHKLSHKKNKSIHKISFRQRNKRYKLSGGSNESSVIPNLSKIDSLILQIKKIDKDANKDVLLKELENRADIMSIQHTYDILQCLDADTLKELLELTDDDYTTLCKRLLDQIKTSLIKYPQIFKNIQILMNDLSTEFGISLESLNEIYDTVPITKINQKLGKIPFEFKDTITYDGNTYTLNGQGSFNKVFINLEQKEAIKKSKFNKDYSFKNEVIHYNNISSLLCNTNYFCKFKSCFSNGGRIYILMEYCGIDLINILQKPETLQFETFIQWFITIAEGIQCMHTNNYVHLDIKLQNITIDDNKAKLIDFGCAQYIPDIIEPLKVGTPIFIAPEMDDGDMINDYKKCDIYSLGVTFAKCISIRYISLFKKLEDNTILSFMGLESMLAVKPKERPTILAVITQLTSLSINTFLRNIKKAEFTVAELHKAGFTVAELHKAGFKLIDIFKGGYTYGEIRDIYKLNRDGNPVLRALLEKYCEKNWNYFKRHTSTNCTFNTICSNCTFDHTCSTNPVLNDCPSNSIDMSGSSKSRSRSGSSKSRSRSGSSKSKSRSRSGSSSSKSRSRSGSSSSSSRRRSGSSRSTILSREVVDV